MSSPSFRPGPVQPAPELTVDVKRVPRRRRVWWGDRELAWRVESIDERGVRRTLVDVETGELLDDVWLELGRVRSWSSPRSLGGYEGSARYADRRRPLYASGARVEGPGVDRPGRAAAFVGRVRAGWKWSTLRRPAIAAVRAVLPAGS